MNDLFWYSCVGVFAGVGFFIYGFFQLKKKRLIENIPTSKIRSMAMGLVEIKGRAVDWVALTGPFSQQKCVYYHYQVEELRRSKNSTYWASIHKGNSTASPFYIEDETAKVLVHPKGAELHVPADFSLRTGFLKDVPGHMIQFLDARGVKYKGFFGTRKTLRFTEHHIAVGDWVYIMGVCRNNRANIATMHQERLRETIMKVKQRPDIMQQFDKNNDGQISAEEWELARQIIAQKVKEKYTVREEDKVYIGKSERRGELFYISDRSEKELISNLNTGAMMGVFGGSALTVACLGYVLFVLT